MSDAEFEELRATTRQHIAAVYELPAEMVEGWDAIDRERAEAERPTSGEEKTT